MPRTYTSHKINCGDRYDYEPLAAPASEIRLLRLHAHRTLINWQDDLTSCSESTFNVSLTTTGRDSDAGIDVPVYHALSYTWGEANDVVPLVCDGKIKEVTRNLWGFLLQIWERMHGHLREDTFSSIIPFDNPLWIDAICINQEDLDEKSQQVQQMGQIYSSAARVIVWLGPHDGFAEDAQDVIVPLDTRGTFDYDPCPPRPESGMTMLVDLDAKCESKVDREEMLEVLDTIMEAFSQSDWKSFDAFVALMNLSYWERAWVVQEVALANHNKALVLIGSQVWAWATLVNAAHTLMVIMYLINHEKDWEIASKWPKDRIATLRSQSVRLDRFTADAMSEDRPLSEYIPSAIFREMKASLLVDHVYSLLSLASDRQTCGVIPDYNKAVAEVYQDVTHYLLRTTGAKALASCEICRAEKLNLPSWVTNLAEHGVWTLNIPRVDINKIRIYAAGGPREDFTYRIDGQSLTLSGRRVDTICHFADVLPSEEFNAIRWLRNFQAFVEKAVQSHGTKLEDAWRIPIADQIGTEQIRATQDVSEAYKELLEHDGMAILSHSAVAYAWALQLWGRCHPPFVTQKGHLGLGRPCARKGDVLWVSSGADTPLIVRENEKGNFQIVAEAYLQDFMDGEALVSDGIEEKIVVV